MPMIGSFYAPGEWAQPNQRNIGDSLMDLYRMRQQIEADRMSREAARMDLENRKIEQQTVLENAKKEREAQKIVQKALEGTPATEARTTIPSVISGLTKGAQSIAGMFSTPGIFPTSLPQMPSFQSPATPAQPVNFQDPQVQAALMRAATIAPSMRPVLDDIIRTTMARQSGRTAAEQADLFARQHEYRMAELRAKSEDTVERLKLLDEQRRITRMGDREYQTKRDAILQGYRLAVAQFNAETRPMQTDAGWNVVDYNAPGGPVAQPIRQGTMPSGTGQPPAVSPTAGAGMDLPAGSIQTPSAPDVAPSGDYGIGPSGMTDGTSTKPAPTAPEEPPLKQARPPERTGGKSTEEKIAGIQKDFRSSFPDAKLMPKKLAAMDKINRTYADIEANPKDAVAQLQMLWSVIKEQDDSVVKESETKFFLLGRGAEEEFNKTIEWLRANPGEAAVMGPKYARQLMNSVRRSYVANLGAYDSERRRYLSQNSKLLSSYGVENPDEVLPPLPSEYQAAYEGTILGAAKTPGTPAGTVTGKDGKKYQVYQTPQGLVRSKTPIEGGQ